MKIIEIPSPRIRTGFLVRENTDHIALAVKRIKERRLAEVTIEVRSPHEPQEPHHA
jgi:hypothetical protein